MSINEKSQWCGSDWDIRFRLDSDFKLQTLIAIAASSVAYQRTKCPHRFALSEHLPLSQQGRASVKLLCHRRPCIPPTFLFTMHSLFSSGRRLVPVFPNSRYSAFFNYTNHQETRISGLFGMCGSLQRFVKVSQHLVVL